MRLAWIPWLAALIIAIGGLVGLYDSLGLNLAAAAAYGSLMTISCFLFLRND